MRLWVYTGSISRWGVWYIRRLSTPKNVCLQLKTLVKTLVKTLLKTLVFPEDFEKEEVGVTLKIWTRTMKREDFCFRSFISFLWVIGNTVLLKGAEVILRKISNWCSTQKPQPIQSFEWSLWKSLAVQSSSSVTETMIFWSLRKLVWLRS
jgi:hypothetical protein